MLRTLFTLLPLMGTALAHLQMKDPLPIDSPLGAGQPKNVDSYSYTAPLKLDGSQWPCHGQAYLSDPSLLTTRATWSAGSTQSFTVAPPGAEHGGGSCQLSLSYDNGQTWNVIWSWIGGCMADTSQFTQHFELPQEAPNGKALFAWGWFNQLGNREMYHNCAVVEITNGGAGLDPTDYPAPFVANAGVNQCSTIENVDPVFPNPGKNVEYGGAYAGSKPEAGKGITGSGCDAPGGANGPGSSGGNGYGNGNGNGGSAPTASSSSSSSAAPPAGSGSFGQGEDGSSGSGPGIAISVSLGAHVLAPVGSSTDAASPASTSAPAATATASASSSGSSSGQRTCRRRRRRSNRTKRSAAPAAPQFNETEHVEARVMRSRLFAQAAGHAARLYNPHTRLAERF